MVRKGKKKRQGRSSDARPAPKDEGRSSDAADPTPPVRPKKTELATIVEKLGNGGFILLLFEAPSGFAVFALDGAQLFLTKAKENVWASFVKDYMTRRIIWLKEFKTFKNKANAINHTGVNTELAAMINKWHTPGQLLAVGKREHQTIIESKLKIPCLWNDVVLEVMWGIKNLMKSLVPLEDSELSKEDRLQMSYGMDVVLRRHGIINVTPEMVDKDIIEHACVLYDCDLIETKHSRYLRSCGEYLKEISDIEWEGWSSMKIATALKILCLPDDDEEYQPDVSFSQDEIDKLKTHGSDYDGILLKRTSVAVHREMVWARELKAKVEKQLKLMIEAKVSNEAAMDLKQEMPEGSEAVEKRN